MRRPFRFVLPARRPFPLLCAVAAAMAAPAAADSLPAPPALPLPLAAVESLALERHPMLAEKSLEVDKAREDVRDLDMGAILPRFELETGMGPAPGIRSFIDSSQRLQSGEPIPRIVRDFDYSEWGPFFGVEMSVAQPLNVGRFRAGRRAAKHRLEVTSAEFQKERLDVSEEAQTLYFQRLYALTMRDALAAARRDLDRAQRDLEEKLDEGAKGVSQTDLLQLRSGRYALDQGWNEASLGVSRTALGLRFLLGFPEGDPLLADTVLVQRPEAIPSLDSVKLFTLRDHPDLKRLENGLAARRELLKVAQGEIGPDLFLFGSFTYAKAWSSEREAGTEDPFARDPLNQISGIGGVGMRLRLNFWQRYQKYRKEKLELKQLQRTEVYAARGLLLQVEDAYVRWLKARADADEARKALRAAEAWLKGAAMKFDLDPSARGDLVGPFRQSVTSKRDYYKALLEYNLSVAKLLKAMGWTLSDYLRNLTHVRPG